MQNLIKLVTLLFIHTVSAPGKLLGAVAMSANRNPRAFLEPEYTEDKEVTLKRLSSGRRLLEAVLIVVAIFAVYLMAALVSFNPSDPSWSQTAWHEPIHNLGGGVGAGWPTRCSSPSGARLRDTADHAGPVLGGLSPARQQRLHRLFRALLRLIGTGVSAYLLWVGGAER